MTIAELKQNIDINILIESAGVELRSRGARQMGLCPFHAEKTPSFFVFPDNRFKCFGCGESGDAIDFIQKLYGLSFQDALRHLGIDRQDPEITPEMRKQIKQRKQRAELVKAFRRWEVVTSNKLASLIRNAHKLLSQIENTNDLERYGNLYHPLPVWEYQFDILCSGNDKLKFEFYQEAQDAGTEL